MNINTVALLSCVALFALNGKIPAETACKVAILTGNVVDKEANIPKSIKTDLLMSFLVKNGIDANDVLGVEQFNGKLYILSSNVNKFPNGNPFQNIANALPMYKEGRIEIRGLQAVTMEIPMERLAKCQKRVEKPKP